MSAIDVPISIRCDNLGRPQLILDRFDGEAFVQEQTLLPNAAEEAKQWIQDEHLTFRLDGAAGDVHTAGLAWHTTYVDPSTWVDAAPAATAVRALQPAPGSPGHDVDIQEIFLDSAEGEVSGLQALLRKQQVSQDSREYVRGSSGAVPFAPGGEALAAADTAAVQAAREAATGAWLAELEGGQLDRICAPGLPHGLFGAWEQPQLPTGASAAQAAEPQPAEAASASEWPESADAAPTDVAEPETLLNGVWIPDSSPTPTSSAAAGIPKAPTAAGRGLESSSILAQLDSLAPAEGQLPVQTDLVASQAAQEVEDLLRGSEDGQDSRPSAWIAGSGAGIAAPRAAAGDTEWAVGGGIPNLAARFAELKPHMAHHFPFELDTFQKEAIIHLEQGESVFVAAHTSAGKTVVAEYALALATQHCTRAVYTSPIKTISNQKFRDFGATFEVGLLTGDVSIKPESPCLIMTTEILRSMLYKGADIIRDIEWVIFDEVHYVNDAERGVVWEEVIIMLPEHVNLVLLSATVPNVMEFADWVGRTKHKKLWVTGTSRRPVPLEHALYYNNEMYTIARQETLLPEGIAQAKAAWKKRNAVPVTKKDAKDQRPTGRGGFGVGRGRDAGRGGARAGARGGAAPGRRAPSSMAKAQNSLVQRGGGANATSGLGSERTQWLLLIDALKQKQQLPVVVFCFSKKRCDTLVDALTSLDLTTADDKSDIQVFCQKALARLRVEDRNLPQIKRLQSMLRRGIGVHHAGLLPIMKEVVEMLFCRGLLRVLFCTETFAMGVNAPARTVVFQTLRKHDGKAFRTLLPGEYTQMAGRAGRRGLDPVGTVLIACWEDMPDESELRKLLTGRATRLQSQFRLTYAMILNLLRVQDLKVEDMLKRSFLEFHAQKAAPEAAKALARGQAALASIRAQPWPAASSAVTRQAVAEYVTLNSRIDALSRKLQETVLATRGAQQALVPGRAVLVADPNTGLAQLAALLSSPSAPATRSTSAAGEGSSVQVLTLRRPHPQDPPAAQSSQGGNSAVSSGGYGGRRGLEGSTPVVRPLPAYGAAENGTAWTIRRADTAAVQGICRSKVRGDFEAVLAGDGDEEADSIAVQLARLEAEAAGQGSEPELLDPMADLKVNAFELVGDIREQQRLLTARAASPCHRDAGIGQAHALVRSEAKLAARLKALAHILSDANLSAMPEFEQRVQVLRKLQYVLPDKTVAVKGRVACEINSGNELVATEIIFAGVLTELTPEEAVALLSALVFQEKVQSAAELPPALAAAAEHATALAYNAAEVQQQEGLQIIPQDFVKSALNFGLMEVVYQWARGMPFSEICELTDVMEGTIVRTIVRLDETCREFRDAARVMGNTALWTQMEAASASIKRDVVFAASLYVA